MPITLDNARAVLDEAVSTDSFGDDIKDRAILAAGDHFFSIIPAATTATSVTIASGASTLNIPATIAGFTQNDILDRCVIDKARVRLWPYEGVLRRWDGGTPAPGQPTMLGFRDDTYALLDKPADAEYTLSVVHRVGFTTFTPGTASAAGVTLNLPSGWEHRVIRVGAAAYLLAGGHLISAGQLEPGGGSLWHHWAALLEEAKREFPSTANGILDRNAPKGS